MRSPSLIVDFVDELPAIEENLRKKGRMAMHQERCPKNSEGKRNPFCPHYAVCLNEAAKKGWLYLDCSECAYRSNRNGRSDIMHYVSSNNDAFLSYTLPFEMDDLLW